MYSIISCLKTTRLLLITTLLWTSLFLFDVQAQTITGSITDSETADPLAGATIQVSDQPIGTSTDEEGQFSLDIGTADSIELTVSYIGYISQTIHAAAGDSPLSITLEPRAIEGGELFVRALRVDESVPIAYTNISRETIEERNLGQDMPYLVRSAPSVVTTSDAGAGIGYTGLSIRGVDQTRINVTINGIPVNDSESHGVFWVNMPDLASSVENIQIQRGVGSSTHGAGAFGATMNMQTGRMARQPFGEAGSSVGSFNTRAFNVHLGSGELGNGWQVEGRLSKIDSDGYIDRASSDLQSYYLSASRTGNRSVLKADVFSGAERTYQAWNGVPEPILENDADELERYIANLGGDGDRLRTNLGNRRFNEFTYDNQVDNYNQDHYHLHYSYRLTDDWLLNTSLHYTYGRGYFEQYRNNDALETYNIDPVQVGGETINRSDLIRRRWLDNHFYGTVISSQINRDHWEFTLGGGYNEYDGDHFGEVIWARFAGESEHEDRYYENNGFKTDGNIYGKLNYYLSDRLSAYLDLQYRRVTYRFLGLRVEETQEGDEVRELEQEVGLDFFNPKGGVVYRLNPNNRLFASLSVGSREPTRRDYVESTPESRPSPERLYDYELGYSADYSRFNLGLNLYYMHYQDQLILTGAVNDVGAYVRENVSESFRTGIELHGGIQLTRSVDWSGSVTWSRNRIPEYHHFLDDFDQGGQSVEIYEDTRIAFSPDLIAKSELQFARNNWSTTWGTEYISRQYLDNTASESRSIDPWLLHDLRAGYSYTRAPWVSSIDLQLQINNLFDHRYVNNGYTFGWIAGGQEQYFNYYFPQAGRHLLMKVTVGF